MATAFTLYFVGAIPATLIAIEISYGVDGYTVVARIIFWPLFALKLLLRVILAGFADLLA